MMLIIQYLGLILGVLRVLEVEVDGGVYPVQTGSGGNETPGQSPDIASGHTPVGLHTDWPVAQGQSAIGCWSPAVACAQREWLWLVTLA